jgi:hypothetical protein
MRSGGHVGLLLGAGALAACAATTDLVAYDEPPTLDSGVAAETSTPDASLGTNDSGAVEAMGEDVPEDGPVLDATTEPESGPGPVDGSDAAESAVSDSGDIDVAADASGDGLALDAGEASVQDAGCSSVEGGTGPLPAPDGGLLSLPSPEIYVGSTVESVTIGDINSDGRNDLVLCTNTQGAENPSADWSVFVFLQNPCGGLSPPVRYPGTPSGHIRTVAIADVTGDGRADLVFDQPNAVGVLPQNAQGTLDSMVVYGLPIDPRLTAVGDLTGDGLADVFAGMSNMVPTSVGYEMVQSAGALQSPVAIDSQLSASDIQIADVTGDGRPDVVLMTGLSFGIIPQQASGTLGAEVVVPAGADLEYVTAMALGDVTGDGRTDLVASGVGVETGAIEVYAQTSSGTLSSPLEYAISGTEGLGIADFDGDGRNDVVSVNVNIEIRLQTPAGTLAPPLQFTAPQAIGGQHPLATGDLNSDGRVDIVLVTYWGVSIVYGTR